MKWPVSVYPRGRQKETHLVWLLIPGRLGLELGPNLPLALGRVPRHPRLGAQAWLGSGVGAQAF